MTEIDSRSPLPKYYQLRTILANLIDDELHTDDPIPSERELQERYKVSRMTVRKAIDELVLENKLYRVSGRGTYVGGQKANVELHLSSFSEDMAARGLKATQRTFQLSVKPSSVSTARELQIHPGDPVITLDRLRLASDRPICFERSSLPASQLPGFLDLWQDTSLYALLEAEYCLRPTWSEQHIGATGADEELAEILQMEPGAPLLRIRQRAYRREQLVEYCISYYRPDLYELWVTLNDPATVANNTRALVSIEDSRA